MASSVCKNQLIFRCLKKEEKVVRIDSAGGVERWLTDCRYIPGPDPWNLGSPKLGQQSRPAVSGLQQAASKKCFDITNIIYVALCRVAGGSSSILVQRIGGGNCGHFMTGDKEIRRSGQHKSFVVSIL